MKIIPISRRRLKICLLLLPVLLLLAVGAIWGWQNAVKWLQPAAPSSVTITPTPSSPTAGPDTDPPEDAATTPPAGPMAVTREQLATDHNFFVEYRLGRDRARSQQVEMLQEVMASANVDETSRQTAHQQYLRLSRDISQETKLENLLRAQGYAEAAVFLDEQSVTVVLKPQNQTHYTAEQDLASLVAQSTGIDVNNVTMILTTEQK